ncbi:ribonuclease HII [bacterium]|nr:ribonuclease HII [bacterium]
MNYIIGTDEAGRGPASGGVWAAAICFNENIDEELFKTLNDSKKLTPKKREALYEPIKENSIWSIKAITVEKIEEINILNASLLAMKYATEDVINKLNNKSTLTLVDGNKLIKNYLPAQKYIIKGDSKSASIAAASILAKVSRDKYMDKIHLEFPQYDWINNKGYLTKTHIEAIQKYGITKYHRLSFLKNITKSLQENSEAQN